MVSVFDLLVLSQIPQIGAGRLRALISQFETSSEVFHATPRVMASIPGFSNKLAVQVSHFLKSASMDEAKRFAEDQLSKLNRAGGEIISYWDARYPELLKRIYDPPVFFFIKGELKEIDRYAIAVVGTRSPTSYGISTTEKLCHEFVSLGITVISGMARGIDTIAHGSVVKGNGRTIAIIGSGINVIYPPENKPLAEKIAKQGAVISEYMMGAKPDAVNFPKRNRIISGMSLGTLVVETDINGGAMITANTALDQNREVFAVPGNVIAKRSKGCNALIKDGRAKLVESIEDILDELSSKLKPLLKNASSQNSYQPLNLSLFEKSVYDILGEEPLHIDKIAELSRCSIPDALVHLLSLEFKGVVKQLPGKTFKKV